MISYVEYMLHNINHHCLRAHYIQDIVISINIWHIISIETNTHTHIHLNVEINTAIFNEDKEAQIELGPDHVLLVPRCMPFIFEQHLAK